MRNGIVFSAFDLLHPGHIYFLESAKSQCDHLTVGLHVNPSMERSYKRAPAQTILERYIQLDACKYVDAIIPYETEHDIERILHSKKYDCRFVGSDYIARDITGEDLVPVIFIDRNHDWSSSDLIERISNRKLNIPTDFVEENGSTDVKITSVGRVFPGNQSDTFTNNSRPVEFDYSQI